MNYEKKFSKVAKTAKASIIRELLKVASEPETISFGGGVPDPETFPREELGEIAAKIVKEEYKITLQYGPTEGDNELKNAYINLLKKHEGIEGVSPENMLITVGSQQALQLIGLALLDEDSYCAVGKPVYLGAVSAFRQMFPKFMEIPLEDDGMNVDILEEKLEELVTKGEIDKFKFVYVVPTFQNPAGVTMSLEKRKKLINLAHKYDFLILEDDPYGSLRFEGEPIPSIYSLDPERTVLLNTFSKILCPGLRIGIIVASKDLLRKLTILKQGVDLCTPSLTQRLAARYLQAHDRIEQLKPTLELYKSKKDTMLKALEEEFGDMQGVSWTRPEGGLFIWLTFPEWVDTMEMFEEAKKNKVLYVPGEAFYVNEVEKNHMRLSFCLPSHEEIKEGIRRLRKVAENYVNANSIRSKS
ncbi:putative transcriptional regulator, GntR family [Petrotoga mobilis SJ95]|jgi:DNA-binding transcriptional MocR family regulator|uniref:Transcriptional regulator, GntR family n=1 Tax=Petrotoga mobilis (strain DSM 10674 / SJ95) TaxID=403833 RepID=A9BIK9_PETMO|nr:MULTISPECIES: PLP-dependent aminotransferase family protein [Petrotoga]ABX32172.1 putative transcriptional regulator, GntR family [Petrotoga mobilis SJ95]MBL5981972.1 aspartate aminotransferase [Petrotoga sp. 8T1HF07.NaAc.6.1]PNR94369.1 aspartate aminotransferase [Petrotoga sp. HWHPT.55.6.3]RPD35332.1 aspartate aminotransferase [Petrotoga sp. HWH.PT.55.6.1]